MRAAFRPEAELTLFLRMRTTEIAKTLQKCIPTEELFPVTGKGGRRSDWRGQIFDWKLVNRRLCTCAVKTRPKTRLFCCQIAKILVPLWATAVTEHDTTVFKPDINLILSANCNKTANVNVKTLTVKTVFNGDTAYTTQLKQQKSKRCYYLGAR